MISLPGAVPTMAQIAAEMLADEAPMGENTGGAAGVSTKARRNDGFSRRLSSSTKNSTTAGGTTRVVFTRQFTREPFFIGTLVELANNGPSDCKVAKFVTASGADWNSGSDQSVAANQIAGCDVYWYRVRALPTLNLAGIVLIGPLLTELGVLSAYVPWEPVAGGVTFLSIAVASSEI